MFENNDLGLVRMIKNIQASKTHLQMVRKEARENGLKTSLEKTIDAVQLLEAELYRDRKVPLQDIPGCKYD